MSKILLLLLRVSVCFSSVSFISNRIRIPRKLNNISSSITTEKPNCLENRYFDQGPSNQEKPNCLENRYFDQGPSNQEKPNCLENRYFDQGCLTVL